MIKTIKQTLLEINSKYKGVTPLYSVNQEDIKYLKMISKDLMFIRDSLVMNDIEDMKLRKDIKAKYHIGDGVYTRLKDFNEVAPHWDMLNKTRSVRVSMNEFKEMTVDENIGDDVYTCNYLSKVILNDLIKRVKKATGSDVTTANMFALTVSKVRVVSNSK